MAPLLSYVFCLLFLWPALQRRFDAPRVRPLARPYARQWAAVGSLGSRVVAVRLQVAIVRAQ